MAGRLRKKTVKPTKEEIESQSRISILTKTLYSLIEEQSRKAVSNRNIVYTHEETQLHGDGVLLRPNWRVKFDDLRKSTYGNSLIAAIIKIRIDDVSPYFEIRKTKTKDFRPGFSFTTQDEDIMPDEKMQKKFLVLAEFFKIMGLKTEYTTDSGQIVELWRSRDRIKDVGQMMIRDILTVDQVCFHKVRNRFGKIIELRYLDPCTIYPVDPQKGFRGNKEISHVQIIDGIPTNQFVHGEIYTRSMNCISDIRFRGSGLSPTETSIMQIVDIIRAIRFNSNRFERPQSFGFLNTAQELNEEQLESLQLQWQNIFQNPDNGTVVPILAGTDVKYTSLNMPSELMFDRLIQILSSLVFANFGMDQAEAGLRLNNSQSLSEASHDYRIASSKDRAKKAMLSFFSDVFNEILEDIEGTEGIKQYFTGIEEDRDAELDRDKKLLNTYMSLDAVRKKNNQPPLAEEIRDMYNLSDEQYEKIKMIGAIPIDPTFNQWATMMIQGVMDQGGGAPEGMPDQGQPEGMTDQAEPEYPNPEDSDLLPM